MITNPIEKYCVRVKSNNITGSGVVLPGRDAVYVLTAAHCLGATKPKVEDILIEKQFDYRANFERIISVDIVEFNTEHDFALVQVELSHEEWNQSTMKPAYGVLDKELIRFYGYQNVNIDQYRPFDGRILLVSSCGGKFRITLNNDTFDQQGENGQYVAKGLSGSGVFVNRHESPFLIGILNSVDTYKGWNDDIECCTLAYLKKYLKEYIDLSDFDTLRKWNENLDRHRTSTEIEQFRNDESEFFNNLYRKSSILYPENVDEITVEYIRKYIGMKDNVKDLENKFPEIYAKVLRTAQKYVTTVKLDYSRTVQNSVEAIDSKRKLQEELIAAFRILPNDINIEMAEYQLIEWLGICTLNFRRND